MITYVLILSNIFPKAHSRAGQPTDFKAKLKAGLKHLPCFCPKLHTIRGNYELWVKRFEKINEGKACISIRRWLGKPYSSSQEEILRLTREDGIGLQKLELLDNLERNGVVVDGRRIQTLNISFNDGLTPHDWVEWFKKEPCHKAFALIHFTPGRY